MQPGIVKRRRLCEERLHGGIHLLTCRRNTGDAARRLRRIERQRRGAVAAFTAEIQKCVEKKLVKRDELRDLGKGAGAIDRAPRFRADETGKCKADGEEKTNKYITNAERHLAAPASRK